MELIRIWSLSRAHIIFEVMIQFTKGNLLESDAQALVNTVNTEGVMGKGIALQFKEMFPENFRLYRDACKKHLVSVGQMFVTNESTLAGTKIIVNFPTKTTWKKPSEYSYIEEGLKSLRNEIIIRNITSIAIPPLGSHNGGLDWLVVKRMIINHLQDLNCQIFLYEPSDAIIEKLKNERVKLTPARAMMLDVLCDMVSYGEFASVFAAEKVVYFLQRKGAQDIFNIEYARGFYGPYSKGKIAHVLYYLNGSYVRGMGGMQTKPFEEIWMLNDTYQVVEDYLNTEENKKYKDICEQTKQFLRGFYSTYSLELLSTIDFILQNDGRLSNWKDMEISNVISDVNEDISKWSQRKEFLFAGSKYVPIILEHLRDIN